MSSPSAPSVVPASAAASAGAEADAPSLELAMLLKHARSLGQSGEAATARRFALRGKNIGLICGGEPGAAAELFTRAATALGARVAHLDAEVVMGTGGEGRETVRVLGKLYDAIECQSLLADAVARIGRETGVPVYDGLATATHPTAALSALIEGSTPTDARERIVQAVLLTTIGRA